MQLVLSKSFSRGHLWACGTTYLIWRAVMPCFESGVAALAGVCHYTF